MFTGIAVFGIAVFYVSHLLARKEGGMERSELAFYIVLISWCSLLVGRTVVSGHRS